MEPIILDAAGHRRSPVTMPVYHRGRPPRNKGCRYPADPPTVDEIIAVMRAAGTGKDAARLRALIVLLWRAGLRVREALDLAESDLDRQQGGILIRRGKGGKRREAGMDGWAWQQLDPWLQIRAGLPVGALLCVIHGPTAGRHWEAAAARKQLSTPPRLQGCGGDSPRISSGMRTRSRWRTKRSARRDPAAARAFEPRDHQRLPPGHR
jgi:integrase